MSASTPVAGRSVRLVVVTGMSGAGRSTAAKAFEDLGWFVVDNVPPALLAQVAALAARADDVGEVAAVVDVRSRALAGGVADALGEARAQGASTSVLFLTADDPTLVRRFEGVRRPHPLARPGDRLVDGIARERAELLDARAEADVVLDTSNLTPHQLRAEVTERFGDEGRAPLVVTVVSFGFKHGLPSDADVVLDLRFLPNPHWDPALRPLSGLDEPVAREVLDRPETQQFLDGVRSLAALVGRGYLREGKRYAEVAVGCTGGRHRSVAVAEELGRLLRADAAVDGPVSGATVRVVHRDVRRP